MQYAIIAGHSHYNFSLLGHVLHFIEYHLYLFLGYPKKPNNGI